MCRYGNIYFTSDAFPGCEAAEIVGGIPPELKKYAKEHYTIGPVVHRDFWNGERASMVIDRGPCKYTFLYFTTIHILC